MKARKQALRLAGRRAERKLQWGRAVEGAETDKLRAATELLKSFNGAAPLKARKQRARPAVGRGGCDASMGPRR